MNPDGSPGAYIAELTGSLRLSSEGEWFHNGVQFQNQKLSDLFSRSVVWDERAQEYFLEIGKQRATFSRDDTPYFVTAIDDGADPWMLNLSDGTREPLEPESLTVGHGDAVYCTVHGSHRAKLLRPAHQTLARHVVGDREVSIHGKTIVL